MRVSHVSAIARRYWAIVPSSTYLAANTVFAVLFFFGAMYLVMYFVTVADMRRLQNTDPEIEWPKIFFVGMGSLVAFIALAYTLPRFKTM